MQELPGRSPAIPVALALPADERPAYLTAECDGNEALRQEVESLLSSHERARSFLETPAVLPRDDSRVTSRLEGQRISSYQIASPASGEKRGCSRRSIIPTSRRSTGSKRPTVSTPW
jgi:hypothetical protein